MLQGDMGVKPHRVLIDHVDLATTLRFLEDARALFGVTD